MKRLRRWNIRQGKAIFIFRVRCKDVSESEFEQLLGRKLPEPHYKFYKKNRIQVDIYTTVSQLKTRAAGQDGFSRALIALRYPLQPSAKSQANVLIMGIYYNPLRAISRLRAVYKLGQLQGMIVMFNGKFFKGLSMFLKEGRKRKKKENYKSKIKKKISRRNKMNMTKNDTAIE